MYFIKSGSHNIHRPKHPPTTTTHGIREFRNSSNVIICKPLQCSYIYSYLEAFAGLHSVLTFSASYKFIDRKPSQLLFYCPCIRVILQLQLCKTANICIARTLGHLHLRLTVVWRASYTMCLSCFVFGDLYLSIYYIP